MDNNCVTNAAFNSMTDFDNFDINQNLELLRWEFCLSTELWENFMAYDHVVNINDFKKIKYFDDNSASLSSEIDKLPLRKGGVYIYILENPILPNWGRYIMYVGRALKASGFSLRRRAKSHFYDYKTNDENPRLTKLFDTWNKYTYLLYLPIDGDDKIKIIENELILALTPPCNKSYPSPKIRRKLDAFSYV